MVVKYTVHTEFIKIIIHFLACRKTFNTSKERFLMRKSIFIAFTFVIALFGLFSVAQAAQFTATKAVSTDISTSSLLQKVHHSYKYWQRKRCAHRWGWGTWRYRRCLKHRYGHGYGHHYKPRKKYYKPKKKYYKRHHCRKVHFHCRHEFGYGHTYRKCMRWKGCSYYY